MLSMYEKTAALEIKYMERYYEVILLAVNTQDGNKINVVLYISDNGKNF